MSLTQEKPLDCNFINNNDHNYLHKKFKKMASTVAISSSQPPKSNENERVDHVAQSSSNSHISNGSIAAAHPEIEKKKINENSYIETQIEKNVQISNNECNRLSHVNNIYKSGQTSITEEFSNKTENLENDFLKDAHNGMTGGRYVCPYCNLLCAKPSVLQKHIRAHTNERPYPCIPCGFAFKTKSNLYKHRRSRTHALRLQGVDASASMNEDDWSAGSESDTSLPPTSVSDAGSEGSVFRIENSRPSEISSPETTSERTSPTNFNLTVGENNKMKTIYKPKFRAFSRSEFSEEEEEKHKAKKIFPTNAEFLNEHISKIISDNEAIVDVIDTPLQKKYSKIKQIAENKHLTTNEKLEVRSDHSPLNLTKNCNEMEHSFRKMCHSENISQLENHKHPLNPEGSIIKDLLLKTKSSSNGIISVNSETMDGIGNLYICSLCQIPYQSVENLEIHQLHYCKRNINTGSMTDNRTGRPDVLFGRSNSVNVKYSESNFLPKFNLSLKSPPFKSKPDNLIIIKPELNDVVAPLPSPGPLLGNTRLVDSRTSPEVSRKSENLTKSIQSPKRKLENRSESYSPRLIENISPRTIDLYSQLKVRCIDGNSTTLRTIDDLSQGAVRHNSTSLQMFGGEVKIVDHSGSTTTLRIEPSKNPLSPILIHQNLSPSKLPHDVETSNIVVRSGLHSGGTMVHNPPTPKESSTPHPQTPRSAISVSPALPTPNICSISDMHFQFPPLGAITAFNPLTLPPLSPSLSPNGATTILHGGKFIPHVPGMPGPNTHSLYIGNQNMKAKTSNNNEFKKNQPELSKDELNGKLLSNSSIPSSKHPNVFKVAGNLNRNQTVRAIYKEATNENTLTVNTIPYIKINNAEESDYSKIVASTATKLNNRQELLVKRTSDVLKTTIPTDNINNQYKKIKTMEKNIVSDLKTTEYSKKIETETRNFNFENLITKAEIFNHQMPSSSEVQKNTNAQETLNSTHNERSETLYFQKNNNVKSVTQETRPKFLRPSTLPLKPGTFTPKRHHGITPNANTMPLVSPETPRPAKAYGQLYLNGNAYTYLGLKCSTKVFYCTINRPQPTYVPNQHFLSMYSNWQLLSELTPDPLGLSAASAMSLYDSRHRPQSIAIAEIRQDLILTHSSQWNKRLKDAKKISTPVDTKKHEESKEQSPDGAPVPKKELTGGFESNEEYTYVRGRGRGRYVCSECGIRCKKPSMLKKHIRTHTDVRPYTCTHCSFSFKTKGNLTKHMKSKAHYKKCCELGINPNEGTDMEVGEMTQGSGETDEESDSDGDEGNEGETESSDTETCKSRLPDHEAAHCLLSLGGNESRSPTSATPGLITSARPSTYPYTPTGLNIPLEARSPLVSEKPFITINTPTDSGIELENEPMDLSKTETKLNPLIPEIPTERESSVLASLASNTAKLPQHQTQWANGEPMLHAYLTERALLDTKIKQSQLTSSLPKLGKLETGKNFNQEKVIPLNNSYTTIVTPGNVMINSLSEPNDGMKDLSKEELESDRRKDINRDESSNVPLGAGNNILPSNTDNLNNVPKSHSEHTSVSESAKYVVSEYLKISKTNSMNENSQLKINENRNNNLSNNADNSRKIDQLLSDDSETLKRPILEHDPIARKVVIGAGGVAFKMATKGQDYEPTATYTPGRLMEDGRRVCDFCNKTFTKPSQLRLHLNIHYMERPFRCSACAVSFRTRGHLQKHERSGSHHNKVSMTSTFGAATSLNPRPFRCSDCNIAFRIHGHLAKHLRSKMHVMRLECLFKLPFGTFTEIERAGVSLTDIDTTDCASSLASLQLLAQKLHEKDPTKLEYRDPNCTTGAFPASKDASEDEEGDKASERDSESRIVLNNECQERSESYM